MLPQQTYAEGVGWRKTTFSLQEGRVDIEQRNTFGKKYKTETVKLSEIKLPRKEMFIRTDHMQALFGLPGLIGLIFVGIFGETLYSGSVILFWVLLGASVIALYVGFFVAIKTKCYIWEAVDRDKGIALGISESGNKRNDFERFAGEIDQAIEKSNVPPSRSV